MSLRGPACLKHRSVLAVVGVCPHCLQERLAVLVHLGEESGQAGGRRDAMCSHSDECVHGPQHVLKAAVDEIKPSDASPMRKNTNKKTLSFLFSQDDEQALFEAQSSIPGIAQEQCDTTAVSAAAGACQGEASSCIEPNSTEQPKLKDTDQTRCRHGSFSERPERYTYSFPVTDGKKPLSWFSVLFRSRKKKSNLKTMENAAAFGESFNGWEGARSSWEAARPSTWEQLRLSSFERPRSSWEPSRPSWDGCVRASTDGETVFSGVDFCHGSWKKVRKDADLECKGLEEEEENIKYSDTNGKQGEENGSSCKHLTLTLDAKETAKTFMSAKAMQLQRDVSTQTSPPRSSDVSELYISQCNGSIHKQPPPLLLNHQPKASHAAWSKVLNKTFSNSKWASGKSKLQKREHSNFQEVTLAMAMAMDEVHIDRASQTSTRRSSFRELAAMSKGGTNTHHYTRHVVSHCKSGDDYYSPVVQKVGSKLKGHMKVGQKEESSFKLENNGLVSFYVTPLRDVGAINKHMVHGPWV